MDGTFTQDEWTYLQTFRRPAPPNHCPVPNEAVCDAQAQLGMKLFYDASYSGPMLVASCSGAIGETGKIACTDCHEPTRKLVDVFGRSGNGASSLGTGWTKRNTPALVDLVYLSTFTWTGAYAHDGEVLDLALSSTAALNSKPSNVTDTIASSYRGLYEMAFGVPQWNMLGDDARMAIYTNAQRALGLYMDQLRAQDAPFDHYVDGQYDAIGDSAKRGLAIFIGKGLCSDCHNGPMFTDEGFHNTGVPQMGEHAPSVDHGRRDVTKDPLDDGKFRTPMLRNVASTAPYMHAGQFKSLGEVIELYRTDPKDSPTGTKDERLEPLDLTEQDALDLEAFLQTLSSDLVDARWAPADPRHPT